MQTVQDSAFSANYFPRGDTMVPPGGVRFWAGDYRLFPFTNDQGRGVTFPSVDVFGLVVSAICSGDPGFVAKVEGGYTVQLGEGLVLFVSDSNMDGFVVDLMDIFNAIATHERYFRARGFPVPSTNQLERKQWNLV